MIGGLTITCGRPDDATKASACCFEKVYVFGCPRRFHFSSDVGSVSYARNRFSTGMAWNPMRLTEPPLRESHLLLLKVLNEQLESLTRDKRVPVDLLFHDRHSAVGESR